MLEQVAEIAGRHGARRVQGIVVRIGPLSGVEPALLARTFPLARAGTVAEGAELTIEELPVRVRCESCGAETETSPSQLLCGECGDWHTQLVSGDELLLASIELLKEEAHV